MVYTKSVGNYKWREGFYNRVDQKLGEKTKSGAIDGSCEFTDQMRPNLEEMIKHIDMTPALAAILSTQKVQLEYRLETELLIKDDD